MRWKTVCRLARNLPEVEEGRTFGAPALRVRGSIVARLRDDKCSILLKVDPVARAGLCGARPDTFSVTPDSEQYAMVVVQLANIELAELRGLLLESWRRSVPPSLVATCDPPGGTLPS
ncbi:MAG: MmcQ/YjbR family DNA-binding protein [Actinomycetota bacterium]|nr:MmcQ/YjbR family DNA-binding protein [Actinomycetota bacterium]